MQCGPFVVGIYATPDADSFIGNFGRIKQYFRFVHQQWLNIQISTSRTEKWTFKNFPSCRILSNFQHDKEILSHLREIFLLRPENVFKFVQAQVSIKLNMWQYHVAVVFVNIYIWNTVAMCLIYSTVRPLYTWFHQGFVRLCAYDITQEAKLMTFYVLAGQKFLAGQKPAVNSDRTRSTCDLIYNCRTAKI